MNRILTKTEIAALKMTLKFLDDLSDHYGNAGCNDFEMENTEEHWEMLKRRIYSNGDKFEIEYFERNEKPLKNKPILTHDFGMVEACSLYIKDLIKKNE